MTKLFVANFPYKVDERALAEMFAKYGTLGRVNIALDRATGSSRGFGFVELTDHDQATAAIRALDGSKVGGRTLHVKVAEESR